jgi:hypothetical protein
VTNTNTLTNTAHTTQVPLGSRPTIISDGTLLTKNAKTCSGTNTFNATDGQVTDCSSVSYLTPNSTTGTYNYCAYSGGQAYSCSLQNYMVSPSSTVGWLYQNSEGGLNWTTPSTGITGSGTAGKGMQWATSSSASDAPVTYSGNDAAFAGKISAYGSVLNLTLRQMTDVAAMGLTIASNGLVENAMIYQQTNGAQTHVGQLNSAGGIYFDLAGVPKGYVDSYGVHSSDIHTLTMGTLASSASHAVGLGYGDYNTPSTAMIYDSTEGLTWVNQSSASGAIEFALNGYAKGYIDSTGIHANSLPITGSNIDSSGNTTGHAASDVGRTSVGTGSATNASAVSAYGSWVTVAVASFVITGPVKVIANGGATFTGAYDGAPICALGLFLNSETGTAMGPGASNTAGGSVAIMATGMEDDSSYSSHTAYVYLRTVSSDASKACYIPAGYSSLTVFSLPY